MKTVTWLGEIKSLRILKLDEDVGQQKLSHMSQGEQTDENSSENSSGNSATPMESEHHLADASLHKEIAIR